VPTANVTLGQDAIIVVTMGNVTSGNIVIEVAGHNYTVPIDGGVATLSVVLPKGTYNATAYYLGDDNYNAQKLANTTKFNVVDKLNASIIINAPEIIVIGNKLIFNVTNNTPVIVTIDGVVIPCVDGNYTVSGLSAGDYTIIARSVETDGVYAGFNSTTFKVVKHNATLEITGITNTTYAIGSDFTITITTNSSNVINVTINGKSYTIDANGVVD